MSAVAGGAVLTFDRGDRMRKAREHAGLELQAVAAALRVGRATLGKYERNEVEPSRAIMIAWAYVTGVDLDWLEWGDPECARRDSNPQPSDP